MSKGLDALESLVDTMPLALIETNSMKYIKVIEKELKALEIIRKRECLFKGLSETTQEEFNLLKEVLL